MKPQLKIGVVVLAAGASTRMGRPKQLLFYNGQTLVRRAAEVALASVCEPVVVVLGANAVAVGKELELPVIVTRNHDWETGMSSSVRVGLEALLAAESTLAAEGILAADSTLDGVMMMLCDQPFVTAELIDRLVECHRETGQSIVATDYRGTHGVPAFFAQELFSDLMALTGDQGARKIIQTHPGGTATVSFTDAAIDVDTPQDYDSLRQAAAVG